MKNLYATSGTIFHIQVFLSSLKLKVVPLEEFKTAVKELKPGKTPGPDSYSASYYKLFKEILMSKFVAPFNSLCYGSAMPIDTLRAQVSLINK